MVALITVKFKKSLKIQYFALISISILILYLETEKLSSASYNYGIFRCVSGFFLGSISYKLFLANKERIIPCATLIEICTIIGIYFFIVLCGDNKFSLLAPFVFTLTVTIFSYEQGAISKLLKAKFIQNLGKWSYSIYMLHAFLILIIGRGFNVLEKIFDQKLTTEYSIVNESVELIFYNSPYLMDLLTIVYLIILVYIASISFKYIEMKGEKLLK